MITIVSALIGLVGIIIVGAIALVVQMVPAVFHLCIFIERFIFMAAAQVSNRLLNIGLLTLISGLVWAAAAAILGTPFLSPYFGSGVTVWLLLAGGLWGLIIGHQAALLEYAHQIRRPGAIRRELPGSLPPSSVSAYTSEKSLEELLLEGTILGETSSDDD